MHLLLTIIHVFVCIVLILVVLLQAGKGASMGTAFGGSSQTVFGSSGPGTFFSKVTAAVAIIFMITSLTLSYMAAHQSSSVLETAPQQRSERGALPSSRGTEPLPPSPPQQLPQAPAAPHSVPPPPVGR